MKFGMRWFEWFQYKIKIKVNNVIYFFRSNSTYISYANQKWLEMGMKNWWSRFQSIPLWMRFVEWRLGRQSRKFAKELKKKNYKPREPWDNGIWK